MISRFLVRLVLGGSLCAVISASAFGQYGGGGMGGGTGSGTTTAGVYTPPRGGYSSATGIGIGAGVAAGAAVLYLVMHNRASLVGCVQSGNDRTTLINEKDKRTYSLVAGNTDLKAGERVALKGKKLKDTSGNRSFKVQKLAKDFGVCGRESALNAASPTR